MRKSNPMPVATPFKKGQKQLFLYAFRQTTGWLQTGFNKANKQLLHPLITDYENMDVWNYMRLRLELYNRPSLIRIIRVVDV